MLNSCTFRGNLTRDPELRTAGSSQVAQFGLSVNRSYKNANGNKVEEAMFIDVEAWGKQAELVNQYLKKGRGVLVRGRLKLDQWEKDGVKHSRHRLVMEELDFLPGSGGGDRRSSDAEAPAGDDGAPPPADAADANDEPPF